jgi:hypothetical protein
MDGTKIETVCKTSDLDAVVDLLKSDKTIPIYDSIRLAQIKLDPTHVLHWVMIYKDYKTNILRQQRPPKPCDCVYNEELFYNNMLRFISKLRYKFLNKNPKMNYYVIKFIIPSIATKSEIFYSNMNSEQIWIKKVRGYMAGNVGCI